VSILTQRRAAIWLIAPAVLAIGGGYGWRVRAARLAREREASYQLALEKYSRVLSPGMPRAQVETYLRQSGVSFRQMCCMYSPGSTSYDDLVPIGRDDPPWYCSYKNVYIGFAFDAVPSILSLRREARESDVLTKVVIFRWLEDCL